MGWLAKVVKYVKLALGIYQKGREEGLWKKGQGPRP